MGLEFHCNNFTGNEYDIYVASGSVKQNQGTVSQGADNHFNTVNLMSIYAPSFTSLFPLKYYYSNQPYHAPYPVSPYVYLYNTATVNPCNSTFCTLTIINPKLSSSGYEPLFQQSVQLQSQLQAMNENAEEYTALRNQYYDITSKMYRIAQESLHALYNEEELDLDAITEWYIAIPTLTAKYSLVETYEQKGAYEQARAALNNIPQQFEFTDQDEKEYHNYTVLFDFKEKIRNSSRNIAQLTEAEIAELQAIAENSNGKSSTMAKGALCFFYNICYETKINFDMLPKSLQFTMQDTAATSSDIQVYPNPTDGNLTVYIPELPEGTTTFQLFDVTGRNLLTAPLTGNYTTINLFPFSQGMYYYKILNNGIAIENGKVVKR
jgi:hypothetical protein